MKKKNNSSDGCQEVSDYANCNNQVYVNNTIFVDEQFGDNKTAVAELTDKPTRTIASAFKLLRKSRKCEDEIWNIIVRLGRYKLNVPVPNNVTLLGSGQGTNIFGNLKVIGNASLIEFKLFSDTIPSIHVNVEEGIDNAVVFFTGLDIQTMVKSDPTNCDIKSPRVAIRINSHALNSTIVIRDCRVILNFGELEEGENKFILTSNSKVNVITSIIQAFGHNSAINTIFENENANVDIEAGNTVFVASSNQLTNPIIFYASSSPNLFFLKDNRVRFSPIIVNSNLINKRPTPNIPNSVIYLLGKENAVIKSRSAISNIQGVDPNQQLIAFAASVSAQISIQGFESQSGLPGGIDGIPEIPDIRNNISFSLAYDGVNSISGTTATNTITLEEEMERYIVKTTDSFIGVILPPINGIHFDPLLASPPSIHVGWFILIQNKSEQDIIIYNPPNPESPFILSPARMASLQWARSSLTNEYFWNAYTFESNVSSPVNSNI